MLMTSQSNTNSTTTSNGPVLERDADGKLMLRSNVTVTKMTSSSAAAPVKSKGSSVSELSVSSTLASVTNAGESALLTVLAEPRVSTASKPGALSVVANPAVLSDFTTREQVLLRQCTSYNSLTCCKRHQRQVLAL